MSRDLAVLGGGLMGLALARLQAARGVRVTVYEADGRPGGLLRATRLGGVAVDRYYHCVLPTDLHLLGLLDDLGVGDRVAWRKTRTGFLHAGHMCSLDGIGDFLRFPLLTLPQRLRLGWTIFRTSRIRSWREVDRVGLEEYLVRLGGRAVFERVWRPLLRCKLGDAYRTTSAAFIWSTINRLYAARATPERAERLGFVRGSYEAVLEVLLRRLQEQGVEVRCGTRVREIRAGHGGLEVRWDGGARRHGVVAATVPPGALAAMVRRMAPGYATDLEQFRFHGVLIRLLLLRRPLTPYYVLNLTDPDVPVTGVVEAGNLAPPDYFGRGRSLLYLPLYVDPAAPEYRDEGRGIRGASLELLRRARPGFREDEIVEERVFRAPSVLPIPALGFGGRIPEVGTPVPGLFFVHNLHVYPRPLHNDAVVEVARRADAALAARST